MPISFYKPIYYYLLMLIVMVTFFHSQIKSMGSIANKQYSNIMGSILLCFILLYIGLRPVDEIFVDMLVYNGVFERLAAGDELLFTSDVLFNFLMKLSSRIMSNKGFFLMCTFFYIIPLFLACKKWYDHYWFYGLLFFVVSFSFFAYGTNTIRSGMAGSIFIYAISRDDKIVKLLFMILACSIHLSMLLPVLAYLFSRTPIKPVFFIVAWFSAIVISLFLGSAISSFFGIFSLGNDLRMSSYLTTVPDSSLFSNTGFRWDFLLYSSLPVFFSSFFVFYKKCCDTIYLRLYKTYLITNAIWILMIRANFTDRFAYLSWVIMPLLFSYPLLKVHFYNRHNHKVFGWTLLFYSSLTFIMFFVYSA